MATMKQQGMKLGQTLEETQRMDVLTSRKYLDLLLPLEVAEFLRFGPPFTLHIKKSVVGFHGDRNCLLLWHIPYGWNLRSGYLLTYLLTYLLHGAGHYLKS
jgi:hypothetical protein